MPTPVSAARACLASDAASALDAAASAARRRSHAQTTSLHVIFSVLSPSTPSPSLLRDALSRARSSSYSPRLQLKALDFCFSVSLDRLPSSASAPSDADDDPPVSNSLMAAIKRSQANQRRHPDTFHLYQQQQQQQAAAGNVSPPAFAGVKVELQQLVLAVLDDPIVSRVFGEAGFRSCDIKLAVLRPPPQILRFPRAARCPPLFLCNFSAAEGLGFSFPAHLAADGSDENCRRIAEVLSRKPGASRNLMLVGVGAAEAARDISRAAEQRNWAGLPPEINGVRVVNIEVEVGDKKAICERLEEVGRCVEEQGVVVNIGDLNGLVEGSEDLANCLVAEVTKALELRRARLWVMGWSATYETYLKFLSRYPLVDKDWDLQLLPITSHRTGMGGLMPKPTSLMDSFVPFGGLFPQSYETLGTSSKPFPSLPRCQPCNEKCEQEVAAILKGGTTSLDDQQKADLPSWMQKADVVGMKGGFDSPEVKDDKNSLNTKIADLQNKWNDFCQHVHRGYQRVDSTNCQVLPHLVGIPYISDTSSFTTSVTNPSSSLGNGFVASTNIPQANAVSTSISLPIATEPKQQDLISKLHDKVSKCEPLLAGIFQSHQAAPSDLSIQDGHSSPSSVTSVTTELVLGAVNNHSSSERKSVPEGSSQCSTPRKVDELSQCASRVHSQASCSPTIPNSPAKGSYIHAQTISFAKTVSGISSIEMHDISPPTIHQGFDVRNYKSFYAGLIGKVGRQEEALWAISEAIFHCKTSHDKRHGPSRRGAIWLSFLGPDRAGKKIAALALAELIFGSRDNLIYIDLASADDNFYQGNVCGQLGLKNWNSCFRGKTMIDHIAMEISKKPMSVFLLDNVDKADLLAQSSLSNAIRTGKFSDSYGREYSINSSIFVTTAKGFPEKGFSPRKENISFSEERILAARRRQMKFLVDPFPEALSCSPISKVSVTSSQQSKSRHGPLPSVYIIKRKLDSSSKHKGLVEYSTKIKRPHRSSGIALDLNLPAEDELKQHGDCNSSSENNCPSENLQGWLEEFFNLMDRTVSFKTFDFDSLADYVLKEISLGFSSTIASNCMLEIDVNVIEQILAATWIMRNRSDLGEWIKEVLCSSLNELRQRHKLSDSTVVKLANLDSLVEEGEPWVFLPSKIILE